MNDHVSHVVTVAVFAALGLALVSMALLAHRRSSTLPTISRLVRAALGRRSVQVLLVLAWWWVGWHFFAAGG
jgi:hypothetical protein